MSKKKQNEMSVLDYAALHNIKVLEVYRLIDSKKIKSKRVNKKDVILLLY